MKSEELDRLEALARAANPGPWYVAANPETGLDESLGYRSLSSPSWGCFLEVPHIWDGADSGNGEIDHAAETLEYVAAVNPPVVLAIVTRIRDLESALAGRQEVVGTKDMRIAQLEQKCILLGASLKAVDSDNERILASVEAVRSECLLIAEESDSRVDMENAIRALDVNKIIAEVWK